MRITKVKLADGNVIIQYKKMNKSGIWDEYSMKCSEDPTGDFYEALSGLSPFVCEMCEFPSEDIGKIKVRGVSFSFGGEKEIMGATIIASKRLDKSNTDLNICTPHKISEFYGENGDEKQLLPESCLDEIDELIKETVKYIEGERAQMDMFKETSEKKETPEKMEVVIKGKKKVAVE